MRSFLHSVKLAVDHTDIHYISWHIVKTYYISAVLALFALDVFEIDVKNHWREVAVARLIRFVLQIDFQDSLLALTDFDISDEYILYDTSAAITSFDTNYAFEFRRIHLAVLYPKILESAADFATYHYATVTILHAAVTDNDILARGAMSAAVVISAALDSDTIVAGVEETILYENVFARLWVATVRVRAMALYSYAANCKVFDEERVDNPERRIAKSNSLNQDIFRVTDIDKLRTETILERHYSFIDRSATDIVVDESVATA